jgi:hypothetical protein
MDQKSVNHLICGVRQVNGMLQILDAEKNNPSITLGELHEQFESKFKIHPAHPDYAFYNQDQFMISLLAYLCMPKERFFNELSAIELKSLSEQSTHDWGIDSVKLPPSIKSLGSLVGYLRNSVAHGHVKVTPELIFEFGNGKDESTVDFNSDKIHKFCRALSCWCLTKDTSLPCLEPLAAENSAKE